MRCSQSCVYTHVAADIFTYISEEKKIVYSNWANRDDLLIFWRKDGFSALFALSVSGFRFAVWIVFELRCNWIFVRRTPYTFKKMFLFLFFNCHSHDRKCRNGLRNVSTRQHRRWYCLLHGSFKYIFSMKSLKSLKSNRQNVYIRKSCISLEWLSEWRSL